MSFSSSLTLKSYILDVTWKKKAIFAEFKDNLICWARLKHPTVLLALVFIVGFYSSERIILVHFFNLSVVMGPSCEVRIENKT